MIKNGAKIGPKRYPGGTWELLGSGSEKRPPFPTEVPPILAPFLEPGYDFGGTYFWMFFGYPPRTTFYDFGAQKASKMEAFGSQFGDFF